VKETKYLNLDISGLRLRVWTHTFEKLLAHIEKSRSATDMNEQRHLNFVKEWADS